jgi:hypothetical protein
LGWDEGEVLEKRCLKVMEEKNRQKGETEGRGRRKRRIKVCREILGRENWRRYRKGLLNCLE